MNKMQNQWTQGVGELIDAVGVFAVGGVLVLASLTGFSLVMTALTAV